ncbi:MAG: hypothetical protein DMG48_00080 [Acidobacteria bacterium]|nr:MAG: hypothetical protein DMG48_00080 [Acidobacteriota bacterium]
MCVANELVETQFFFHIPVAGFGLAFGLNDAPTIVPPAVIVVGGIRSQPFRRRGGVVRVGAHGSEYEQLSANGDLVVEDGFLCVGLAGQDENGTDLQRFHPVDRAGARSSGEPILIFRQQLPNRGEMFRLLRFEIEIQRD